MRQPDHWYARNFAVNDASTREHVRQTLIPRWRKERETNETAISHLRRIGRDENDPILTLVLDETQEIKENIAIVEERLNITPCTCASLTRRLAASENSGSVDSENTGAARE